MCIRTGYVGAVVVEAGVFLLLGIWVGDDDAMVWINVAVVDDDK